MKEIWKPVFNGVYRVSNLGRIRRITAHQSLVGDGIMKTWVTKCGYVQIEICVAGKRKKHLVHRLVAAAFVAVNGGGYVDHKNGVKTDNRADNLEWVTCRENIRRSYEMGLSHRGERHSSAKLTEEQVLDIRARYTPGGYGQLAREYGVDPGNIRHIVLRNSWKHI